MNTIIEEGKQPAFDRKQSLKIKTILVPLDFSHLSMQVLKYAIPFAKRFEAAIHLVHVQPPDEATSVPNAGHLMLKTAEAIALLQDRLAKIKREHAVSFWPDNCHVRSGQPFQEICEMAVKINADLIILPTRGHSGLKHILLGSTAERVIRYAPCPVLVPRGRKYQSIISKSEAAKFEVRKILSPVDFSECSLVGVKYAFRLAETFGATLRFFHAIYPFSEYVIADRVGVRSSSLIDAQLEASQEQMKELKQMKFLRGISCETEIRTGYPIDEICSETSRTDIDLVVTSTHGRTGFKHALIGSVAEHVVRYAECPVMVIPSRPARERN